MLEVQEDSTKDTIFQFYISTITILQNAGEWRLCINAIAIAKVMFFCEFRCQ